MHSSIKPIQMVDLQSQYLRLQNQIDEEIKKVLVSTAFIKGPQVAEFERSLEKHLNVNHVIGCANGTDALQIALMALNLPQGAEVITPAFSYAALAEVILLLNLKPVFVDANPDTFTIDVSQIESKISTKTRVIAPVHLYGQCADMDSIMQIANKHNLYVIEDNAQAIGSQYTSTSGISKFAGTIGHIGTTSFFPSKNLGCYGDGGAVTTNNKELAQNMQMIANHGQKQKYMHQIVGLNSRLDTIQAAILNVKLKHLNQFEQARQSVASFYDTNLANLPLQVPTRNAQSTHVFHQYTIKLQDASQRDALKNYLQEKNVPSMVYYPIPLHLQEAYKQEINLPITQDLTSRVLSLPISTEMETAQLEYIVTQINQFFNS